MNLTDAKIRAEKPATQDRWLADRDGLYLRISPKGAKSFYLRKSAGGKRVQQRLGRWPAELSLADARRKAATFNHNAAPTKGTFAEIVNEYENERILARYKRPGVFASYRNAMLAELGHLSPDEITTAHLSQLIRKHAAERGKRSGDALRSHLRACIAWAAEQGWMDNIASGISSKTSGYEYKPRKRVLSDDEIRAIWHTDSPHTPLLRALLLTGLRIGELKLATRDHLEQTPDGTILHIPAEHAKNGDATWVYVTDTLAEQFKANGSHLFAELTATGTQSWVKRWHERNGTQPWTPHDLRRTFSTRLNGDLGIAPHVVEKMLNHRMQGVMAAYNQAEYRDDRIAAYKAWKIRLLEIVGHE